MTYFLYGGMNILSDTHILLIFIRNMNVLTKISTHSILNSTLAQINFIFLEIVAAGFRLNIGVPLVDHVVNLVLHDNQHQYHLFQK